MNEITVKTENRTAIITIERPESFNAMTTSVFNALANAVKDCSEDPSLGSLIITGAGKAFSSGGDIKGFKESIDRGEYLPDELIAAAGSAARAIRNCPLPVVAMVNGPAAGAGVGIMLACDFRVMSSKAKIVTAFTDIAAPGDTCTLYFLGKMLGTSRMMRYAMISEPITAQEAYELGIACQTVAPEELEESVMKLAQVLNKKPAGAIAIQKKYINRFLYGDMEDVITFERQAMTSCSRLPDFTEAVSAFLEQREPAYLNSRIED